jgi:hypothetical protein
MPMICISRKDGEVYRDKTSVKSVLSIDIDISKKIEKEMQKSGIDRFEELEGILESGVRQIHEEVIEILSLILGEGYNE